MPHEIKRAEDLLQFGRKVIASRNCLLRQRTKECDMHEKSSVGASQTFKRLQEENLHCNKT